MIENVFLLLKIVVIYYFIMYSVRLCFLNRKSDPKLKYTSSVTKLLSIINEDWEDFSKESGTGDKNQLAYKRGLISVAYAIIAIICVLFFYIADTVENDSLSSISMLLVMFFNLIAYISTAIFWIHSFINAIMQLILNKSKISYIAIITCIIALVTILSILL